MANQYSHVGHRAQLLAHIKANPTHTYPDIAKAMGWSVKFTLAKLWAAADAGQIKVHNDGVRRQDRTYSVEPVKPVKAGKGKVVHPERVAPLSYRHQMMREMLGMKP